MKYIIEHFTIYKTTEWKMKKCYADDVALIADTTGTSI